MWRIIFTNIKRKSQSAKRKSESKCKVQSAKLKAKSFTLVEVLVAGTILILAIPAIIQIYLHTLKNHRILVSISEVSDNIGFAIEKMNREIRMGRNFVISDNGEKLTFYNPQDEKIVYRFNKTNHSIERSKNGGDFENLTGENVIVEKLIFHGEGLNPNDNLQPRITIVLKFRSKEAQKESEKYSTELETTISSRLLQI